MLHNEARNILVGVYEKTQKAKEIALAYGVSMSSVYRLAEQKARRGSTDDSWNAFSAEENWRVSTQGPGIRYPPPMPFLP